MGINEVTCTNLEQMTFNSAFERSERWSCAIPGDFLTKFTTLPKGLVPPFHLPIIPMVSTAAIGIMSHTLDGTSDGTIVIIVHGKGWVIRVLRRWFGTAHD